MSNCSKPGTKQLKRARKGITPVIAIVLLIMMTVAAAGAAWVWITQLMDTYKVTPDELGDIQFEIAYMLCNSSSAGGPSIDAKISNRGTKPINADKTMIMVYSDSISGDNLILQYTTSAWKDADFTEPGKLAWAELPISANALDGGVFDFNPGDFYYIKIQFPSHASLSQTYQCRAQ